MKIAMLTIQNPNQQTMDKTKYVISFFKVICLDLVLLPFHCNFKLFPVGYMKNLICVFIQLLANTKYYLSKIFHTSQSTVTLTNGLRSHQKL